MSAPVLPLGLSDLDPIELALEGVVPSLIVAVLALGLAWRVWTRAQAPAGAGSAWGLPLALGVGFFATFQAMLGWPGADWYPDMKTRVAWVALAAAAFGLVQAGAQRAWRLPAGGFFLAASTYLLAHWRLQGMWDWPTTLAWILGASLAATILYVSLEALAWRRGGAALPLALSVGTGTAALTYFLAHSENYARLASGLAAALGVAFVVGLRKPTLKLARGGVVAFVAIYGGLALAANRTADLPPLPLALVLVAPLCAWAGEFPPLRSARPRVRAVLVGLAVVLPLAAAVFLTRSANPATGADAYLESLGT